MVRRAVGSVSAESAAMTSATQWRGRRSGSGTIQAAAAVTSSVNADDTSGGIMRSGQIAVTAQTVMMVTAPAVDPVVTVRDGVRIVDPLGGLGGCRSGRAG